MIQNLIYRYIISSATKISLFYYSKQDHVPFWSISSSFDFTSLTVGSSSSTSGSTSSPNGSSASSNSTSGSPVESVRSYSYCISPQRVLLASLESAQSSSYPWPPNTLIVVCLRHLNLTVKYLLKLQEHMQTEGLH